MGGVGDLERDPSLRVEADSVLRAADHLGRDVDTADPRVRELPGDQQRAVAEPGADVEGALGLGAYMEQRGGQRSQVCRRPGRSALIPTLRHAVEEAAHRSAHQWPARGEPRHQAVEETADQKTGPHAAIIAGAAISLRCSEHGADSDRGRRGARPDRRVRRPGRDRLDARTPGGLHRGRHAAAQGDPLVAAQCHAARSRRPRPWRRAAARSRSRWMWRGRRRRPRPSRILRVEGVYNDTLFHRIVPGFVVQGGDPTGSGTGGPGYSVDEQPPQNLSYTRGVVAMAKSPADPPGRSGSQFFVVTEPGCRPDPRLRPARACDQRPRRGAADRAARHAERQAEGAGRHPADHDSRRLMAKLRVGDSAPDFDLEGTGSRRYGLADFRSKGVILAFYPGDFTPVCTKQFCSYRDDGDRIEALGMPMVGISPQSVSSHERFADRHGLTVPLLSDPGQEGRAQVRRPRARRIHPTRDLPRGFRRHGPLSQCGPLRPSLPGRRRPGARHLAGRPEAGLA